MAWTAGSDQTTGTLITATIWNNYLGTSGSVQFLGDKIGTASATQLALDDGTVGAPVVSFSADADTGTRLPLHKLPSGSIMGLLIGNTGE
ncbi:MAG: hypothetical protein VW082_02075 [Candidatus Nanopelagicales bacterium]